MNSDLTKPCRAFSAIVAFALSLTALPAASGAAVYWDADGTINGTYGGTGTWDATSPLWASAATINTGTDDAWIAGNDATFLRGTTNNVTVGIGGITANRIVLGASTGSFTSGTGSTTLSGGKISLSLGSGSNALSADNGTSATIANAIDLNGTGGLAISTANSSTISISGAVTNGTGVANTLALTAFNSSSAITITGNISSSGAGSLSLNIGATSASTGATYSLGGNNTFASVSVLRGTVVVNSATALGQSGTIVTLGGGGNTTADTQTLLIGTAGLTLGRTITLNSADTTDTRTIGSNISSGTASYSGNLNLAGTGASLRADAGGTTVFSGVISDSTASLAITKTGAGIVQLSSTTGNTYDGGTTVSAGTLLANNTSGSGTGSGVVNVNSGATLGGSGIIAGATTAASGSFLAAGPSAGTTGTLTFGGTLDISGLASGTGGLLFDLAATGASDKIFLTSGALSIGNNTLNFNDFTFNALSGFDVGTYTLLSTTTSIVGTLGANLTGTINGLNATLAISGNDIVLTVSAIPEPSTCAAILGALTLGGALVRRRRRNHGL